MTESPESFSQQVKETAPGLAGKCFLNLDLDGLFAAFFPQRNIHAWPPYSH
jgi:hypothetical protein